MVTIAIFPESNHRLKDSRIQGFPPMKCTTVSLPVSSAGTFVLLTLTFDLPLEIESQISPVIDKYFSENSVVNFGSFWQLCQVRSHTSISPSNACTAKRNIMSPRALHRGGGVSVFNFLGKTSFQKQSPTSASSKLAQDFMGVIFEGVNSKLPHKNVLLSVTSHYSPANHVPKRPSGGQTTNNKVPPAEKISATVTECSDGR